MVSSLEIPPAARQIASTLIRTRAAPFNPPFNASFNTSFYEEDTLEELKFYVTVLKLMLDQPLAQKKTSRRWRHGGNDTGRGAALGGFALKHEVRPQRALRGSQTCRPKQRRRTGNS